MFPTDQAASAALVLYAKSSMVGCLENLFEKQIRQDPELQRIARRRRRDLDRQDIAGLGDESVVYEGSIVLTGTDGSTQQLGIGSAAVRVGRTVDVVTYSTDRRPRSPTSSPPPSTRRWRGCAPRSPGAAS